MTQEVPPFSLVLMDVPWWTPGDTPPPYPMVKDADVRDVVMCAPCWRLADDCALFFWAINNKMEMAFPLVRELGFKYVTMLTWAKHHGGIGRYFRGQTEHLLFAYKGKSHVPRAPWGTTLITGERTTHSRKPDSVHERLEKVEPYNANKLEMFARRPRPGWTVWGNEIVG